MKKISKIYLLVKNLLRDKILGMKKVYEIKGVYDDDLIKLLEDLGLKDDFENGKIRCVFSDEVISIQNLLSIFSDGETVKFVCNNDIAKEKLAELNTKYE